MGFSLFYPKNKQATENNSLVPHYDFVQSGKVGVISAPSCYGQPKQGVDLGPDAILENDVLQKGILDIKNGENTLWESVSTEGIGGELQRYTVDFDAEMPFGIIKKPRAVGKVTELLHNACFKVARQGKFVLTLGGDHSIVIGSISGVQKKYHDLAVVWVDAHSDIHTPDSTTSGNLHGCPLSFLLGLNKNRTFESFDWFSALEAPIILPTKLVYIGLRDVDEAERRILKQLNIVSYTMRDVIDHGIAKITEMAIKTIDPKGKCPIHLSFDIDSLDPSVAPSTGTPVCGGLLEREGKYICESLAKTGRLVSMDMVEVNPKLGTHEDQVRTVKAAQSIIYSALGYTYL